MIISLLILISFIIIIVVAVYGGVKYNIKEINNPKVEEVYRYDKGDIVYLKPDSIKVLIENRIERLNGIGYRINNNGERTFIFEKGVY